MSSDTTTTDVYIVYPSAQLSVQSNQTLSEESEPPPAYSYGQGPPIPTEVPPPYSGPSNSYQNHGFVPLPPMREFPIPLNGNRSTNLDIDTVTAAQAVNAAIHQNGRAPVSVVCPTCKTLSLTELTETPNTTIAQGQSKILHIAFGGSFVIIIGLFLVIFFISESVVSLVVMPVFLLFVGFGYYLVSVSRRNALRACCDIQHHCGHCKILLGISSGAQYYQQLSLANALRRRRV